MSREPTPPGIARNCYGYAAGGMPLAFTQEDFLVFVYVLFGAGQTKRTREKPKFNRITCTQSSRVRKHLNPKGM